MLAAMLVLGCASSARAAGDFQARTWGINTNGELGIGTDVGPETCLFGEPCSTSPVAPSALEKISAAAAGAFHSLALTEAGTVLAWGFNGSGQLGESEPTESPSPVAVQGLSGVVAVAAGHEFSLALLSNGTVMAWGENNFGQLGNGTHTPSSTPVQVSGLSGVTAIVAGANHAVALLGNGTVKDWGAGSSGQLGNGASTGSSLPVAVNSVITATAVAAGQNHTLARLSSGKVVAWGENAKGQLGNNRTANSNAPVNVSGLAGATAIAAGGGHSMALLSTGAVDAWGDNGQGELGNNSTTSSSVPVTVSGLSGVTQIAAGYFHSLATTGVGAVWSWGYNGNGQLGTGSTTESDVPVAVPGVAGIKGLSANQYDTIAVGASPPSVSGVSPNGGPTGGSTAVTISGLHLGEAEKVLFGATPAKSFTVNSSSSISAVSPSGSGTVDVTVTTGSGTSPATPADQFKYVFAGPPPTVTGVAPAEGTTAGGTAVTITGTQLAGAGEVRFGATPAASFKVQSATSVTAVSPAGTGTVDVTVSTPAGVSETGAADHYTFVPPGPVPAVTKVKPNKGAPAGGATVTVTGSNLTGATGVLFGSRPATSFEVKSAEKLTAVSPPGSSGAVDVTVTNANGASTVTSKDLFRYGAGSVTGVSPSSGPKEGGTTVTVTGVGFAPGSSTVFVFGKVRASAVECASTTTCTMRTGASASSGTVDVRAVLRKTTSAKNPPGDSFTYS
jgi:alpha-tubulin suppressor-like RCC1 family protein